MLSFGKVYLLAPALLLGVFSVFERDAKKTWDQKEAAHLAQIAAEKAEAEERRVRFNAQAALDAKHRVEERAKQEHEQSGKKLREHEAALRTLEAFTATQAAEADRLDREIASASGALAALRVSRTELEQETFVLEKEIERRRIDRRNAESETQRAARLAGTRLLEHDWTTRPSPAAARGVPSEQSR